MSLYLHEDFDFSVARNRFSYHAIVLFINKSSLNVAQKIKNFIKVNVISFESKDRISHLVFLFVLMMELDWKYFFKAPQIYSYFFIATFKCILLISRYFIPKTCEEKKFYVKEKTFDFKYSLDMKKIRERNEVFIFDLMQRVTWELFLQFAGSVHVLLM